MKYATFAIDRHVAIRTIINVAVLLAASFQGVAGTEGTPSNNGGDGGPALFVLRDGTCEEDYASELRAAGVPVHVREFETLDAVRKIAKVPADVDLKHLLIGSGYVVANHVSPELVAGLFSQRPDVRGLIGSAACATGAVHDQLHAASPRLF